MVISVAVRYFIVMNVVSLCSVARDGVHLQVIHDQQTSDYDSILVQLPVEFQERVSMKMMS